MLPLQAIERPLFCKLFISTRVAGGRKAVAKISAAAGKHLKNAVALFWACRTDQKQVLSKDRFLLKIWDDGALGAGSFPVF